MSEEATTVEAPQIAEGTRSPVEPKVSTEVEPNNQEQEVNEAAQNVNQLVSESRKYRKRAQQSEAELSKLKKQIELNRQTQFEENK